LIIAVYTSERSNEIFLKPLDTCDVGNAGDVTVIM